MASVLSRGAMKKDATKSEKGGSGVPSSRPSSGSSVSSKTSTSKSSSQKVKGPSKEELKKANEELFREVEMLNGENQVLKATISAVIEKLIENAKIKGVDVPEEIDNPNVCEIPTESIVYLTEEMTAEEPKSHTMEGRIEELETRITHLNMELAKLLRTRINLENGLDDLIESPDLEYAKCKAKELKMEIRGSSLFTFLDSVPVVDDNLPANSSSCNNLKIEFQHSEIQKHQVIGTVNGSDKKLDLTPPLRKYPGDTHIKNMHKDLRQYIIQQLSLQKANGADWRMIGERIGIAAETLSQWKRWKLENPMFYVLQTWSQSPGATVRLLHRHLVSPQMRNTLLAKRLSDFYMVD